MNSSALRRSMLAGWVIGLACLTGCPAPQGEDGTGGPPAADVNKSGSGTGGATARVATANQEDVKAARELLDGMGPNAQYTLLPHEVMTEIVIRDGSTLSGEDIALLGRLTDLEKLQILNFRSLNDEMAAQLAGLKNLTVLALTNSVIGDSTVEMIVKSFPNLTSLDLSSNTNMTNGVLKVICQLGKLERLTLVQNRFSDLGTGRLSKLQDLRLLDLRGNMEAGDMTLEVVGALPNLAAFKHRSTTVTDLGMEYLGQSKTLKSLLIQDFNITSQSGPYLAKLVNLTQLEIFRCQGFGSEGVLALKGMQLERLTLRDLPMVDNQAMEVLQELPQLKRLYLHELSSLSDDGLQHLGSLKSLQLLDIWSVPQMTDATIDVIATLPDLQELSIRTTGVSDAAVDKLLAMPSLQSVTFKDNGMVTAEGLQKLSTKAWSKLDIGQ